MKSEALFINGVYESVLEEINNTQSVLPEQILFLQPYSSSRMSKLQASPPTVDHPVRLYLSTTNDLNSVHYTAEIVGWADKEKLSERKKTILNDIIKTFQPNEIEVYNALISQGKESCNLLFVRRLQKLDHPFPVGRLIKTADGKPLSAHRTRAGGWSYVQPEPLQT